MCIIVCACIFTFSLVVLIGFFFHLGIVYLIINAIYAWCLMSVGAWCVWLGAVLMVYLSLSMNMCVMLFCAVVSFVSWCVMFDVIRVLVLICVVCCFVLLVACISVLFVFCATHAA